MYAKPAKLNEFISSFSEPFLVGIKEDEVRYLKDYACSSGYKSGALRGSHEHDYLARARLSKNLLFDGPQRLDKILMTHSTHLITEASGTYLTRHGNSHGQQASPKATREQRPRVNHCLQSDTFSVYGMRNSTWPRSVIMYCPEIRC